jgi:hypothetical protein
MLHKAKFLMLWHNARYVCEDFECTFLLHLFEQPPLTGHTLNLLLIMAAAFHSCLFRTTTKNCSSLSNHQFCNFITFLFRVSYT